MSMPQAAAETHPAAVGAEDDGPGPIGRWIAADRVRAVAIALIVVSVASRAGLAARGWFSQDEFVIAAQVLDTRLDRTTCWARSTTTSCRPGWRSRG